MQQQFENFQRDQAKQAELLQGLVRELAREELPVIADKLSDPEPMVRWLAIQVVSRQWLPLESDLVQLLADPHPGVKTAAHQTLVRLGRGTDFGPAQNASSKQFAQARSNWRGWLENQTPCPEPDVSPTR